MNCYPQLKFGKGNAKLDKVIATFSLPSGYACPFAMDCLSKADPVTGKIKDGPDTLFRCFAASQEALYKPVRKARWHNFNLLRKCNSLKEMQDLIVKSLPKQEIVRIHVAGDFYCQRYFDAWLNVAKALPHKTFYAYTKSLPFVVNRLGAIPSNFKVIASRGGKHDNLIVQHNLVYAEVVYSEREASELGLEIDHDDSHAISGVKSFALLLHGTQPANTIVAEALKALRKQGKGGYPRK